MNKEYIKLCQKDIQNLLDKKLIRESDSPWNCYGYYCYGFYVNKHSEQIIGIQRLVINYHPAQKCFSR